jgi:hypothetical protein
LPAIFATEPAGLSYFGAAFGSVATGKRANPASATAIAICSGSPAGQSESLACYSGCALPGPEQLQDGDIEFGGVSEFHLQLYFARQRLEQELLELRGGSDVKLALQADEAQRFALRNRHGHRGLIGTTPENINLALPAHSTDSES